MIRSNLPYRENVKFPSASLNDQVSNPTMGAWFSKMPISPEEEHEGQEINSHYTALTRIRILPQSKLSPIVRDVSLPASAVASLDALLDFIETQSTIVKILSNYELSKDHVQLLQLQDGSGSGPVALEFHGDDTRFGLQMDRVWVMNQRCVISIVAYLKGDTFSTVPEKATTGTDKALTSFSQKDRETKVDAKDLQVDADFSFDEVVGDEDKPTEDVIGKAHGSVIPVTEKGGDMAEEDGPSNHEQLAKDVSSMIAEDNRKGKSQVSVAEPTDQPDDSPINEQVRQQAHSPSPRKQHSQHVQDQAGKILPVETATTFLRGGSVKTNTPTQAPVTPSSSTAGYTDDTTQLIDDERRAKLQQQLQDKISSSLKSRGKPTSSKSPTQKIASSSAAPKKEGSTMIKPTGGAQQMGRPGNSRSESEGEGVAVPSDFQSRRGPFSHEDWIKSRSMGHVQGASNERADNVSDEEL